MKESRTITYREIEIAYTLIKSNRKSYSIHIDNNAEVIVRVPLYFTQRQLEEVLREREAWIVKNYNEQKEKHEEIKANEFSITDIQKRALEKRYIEAAKEYIPKRVSFYLQYVEGNCKRITIRDQATRWGSCSSSGTLSFNWRIMLAPPEVLDYVVVHEVCHFEHMNHSKDFWQAVEHILPNYKTSKKWLKENGSTLTVENSIQRSAAI